MYRLLLASKFLLKWVRKDKHTYMHTYKHTHKHTHTHFFLVNQARALRPAVGAHWFKNFWSRMSHSELLENAPETESTINLLLGKCETMWFFMHSHSSDSQKPWTIFPDDDGAVLVKYPNKLPMKLNSFKKLVQNFKIFHLKDISSDWLMSMTVKAIGLIFLLFDPRSAFRHTAVCTVHSMFHLPLLMANCHFGEAHDGFHCVMEIVCIGYFSFSVTSLS